MKTKIRYIRLRAITTGGAYGADLQFQEGLNILTSVGENTTGKSTCLQAVIYALGLEKMLSPRREIPLPYVMRDEVRTDPNKKGSKVVESYVELEIENSLGESIVVHRQVKGDGDTRLISCWSGPRLTDPSTSAAQRDFFVFDPGSASREAGFHTYLANFLGWQLPDVPRFDGTTVPLYVETIFPMVFVEQKRGWSAIQGPFPTYLQIQDIGRRVVEFLMDLDAQRLRLRRRELQQRLEKVTAQWRQHRETLRQILRTRNARVSGLPAEPSGHFALDSNLATEVLVSGAWVPLATALRDARDRLDKLREAEIPKSGDDTDELESALEALRARLDEFRAFRDLAYQELHREQTEVGALRRRLAAVQSDLDKNQRRTEAKKIRFDLGDVSCYRRMSYMSSGSSHRASSKHWRSGDGS
jgi:DNA repair exonuclease SbcCD ATPase subunit